MNKSFRIVACPALIALVLTACQSDVKPVADALAQDSTLALDVLSANQDTALAADYGDRATEIDARIAAGLPLHVPAAAAPEVSEPQRGVSIPARVVQNDDAPISVRPPVRRSNPSVRRARSSAQSPQPVRTVNAQRPTVDSRRVTANGQRTTSLISSPSRAWLILPAGSELELEAGQRICSNTAMAGDVFNATLTESVMRANGTIIPEGSSARAEVTSVGPDANSKMSMRIQSLLIGGRTYQVSSRVTYAELKKVRSGSGSAAKVATGAAAGAVLGQVLGRNTKSTVIGAAGGAATGAVLAGRSGRVAQCLPDGGRITAELTEPLRILLSE